jgi:erythronate-4-phosphate dehydrogenase
MVVAPLVLVDNAVLAGTAHAFPLHWLDGLRLAPYEPRHLAAAAATEATAAIVRSMTRVDADVLRRLPNLAHVATLSSGTDHLDLPLLAKHGIAVHTGRGGNARAVADWCDWALHRGWALAPAPDSLQGKKVLVVGVGAVGSLVARLLLLRGATVVLHDPPRQLRQPGGPQELPGQVWSDLPQALDCGPDAVTLHVPLVDDGPFVTRNWLSEPHLKRVSTRGPVVVLQASRGGVMDERFTSAGNKSQWLRSFAVDTFCHEPHVDVSLVTAANLATPHIAGHSAAGKLDVARRALQGLRAALDCPALLDLTAAVADRLAHAPAELDLSPWAALDRASRDLKSAGNGPATNDFDHLRHNHLRRESQAVQALAVVLS